MKSFTRTVLWSLVLTIATLAVSPIAAQAMTLSGPRR